MRSDRLLLVCAVLLTIGFSYGLYRLFDLRFEHGDVYPPYSTLRTDPLGARVFYEALEKLPGVRAERHFHALDRLDPGRAATLFIQGIDASLLSFDPDAMWNATLGLARSGYRVVVAFKPDQSGSGSGCQPFNATGGIEGKDGKTSWRRELGIGIGDATTPWQEGTERMSAKVADDRSLPATIPLHTTLTFETTKADWKTLYAVDQGPVLVERQEGNGTLVFMADAYLLSNEAMRSDRSAPFLSWLVGGHDRVVFHEASLGVVETFGVMTLIKRYRLQGMLAGLLVAAALFFWREAALFVPMTTNERGAEKLDGKDQFSGLVGLLRRNIDTRSLLTVCVSKWEQSVKERGTVQEQAVDKARELASTTGKADGNDPVAVYNNITKLFARRWK